MLKLKLFITLFIISTCQPLYAAFVIGNGISSGISVWGTNYDPRSPEWYYSLAFHDDDSSRFTYVEFTFNVETGIFDNATHVLPDRQANWYLASFGDEFNAANISNGDFPLFYRQANYISGSDGPESIINGFSPGINDFYIAAQSGVDFSDDYSSEVNNYDDFGWVHLQVINNELVMLGNAVNYGSSGITVGQVPLPSSLPLLLSGAALIFGTSVKRKTKKIVPTSNDV